MSNSLKQSKVLLENWRKFYLKEAEEPTAGGNVVRIFDFDGTLSMPKEGDKYTEIIKNPFYIPFLNTAQYNTLFSQIVAKAKASLNSDLVSKINPSTDYIITALSTIGFDKNITPYLLWQLSQRDPQFIYFIKNFTNIPITVVVPEIVPQRSQPEDYDGGYDDDYFEEPDIEPQITASADAISEEDAQKINDIINKHNASAVDSSKVTSAKDIYRLETEFASNKEIVAIVKKLKKAFDVGKKVSKEDLINFKKDLIVATIENFDKSHVAVALNIVKFVGDEEKAGTSGKAGAAMDLTNKLKLKNKKYSGIEIYDNNSQELKRTFNGLTRSLDPKIDDIISAGKRAGLDVLQSRIKSEYNIKSYLVGPEETKEVQLTAVTTSKGSATGIKNVAKSIQSLLSNGVLEFITGRTSIRGSGYPVNAKNKKTGQVEKINVKIKPYDGGSETDRQNTFKKIAETAGAKDLANELLIKAGLKTASTEEGFQSYTSMDPSLLEDYYNKLIAQYSSLSDAIPSRDQLIDDQLESRGYEKTTEPVSAPPKPTSAEPSTEPSEALYETILKELKPMLAQLSKIANTKRK